MSSFKAWLYPWPFPAYLLACLSLGETSRMAWSCLCLEKLDGVPPWDAWFWWEPWKWPAEFWPSTSSKSPCEAVGAAMWGAPWPCLFSCSHRGSAFQRQSLWTFSCLGFVGKSGKHLDIGKILVCRSCRVPKKDTLVSKLQWTKQLWMWWMLMQTNDQSDQRVNSWSPWSMTRLSCRKKRPDITWMPLG